MHQQNSISRFSRERARYLSIIVLLSSLLTICLSNRAAAQTNYPTTNGHIMRLRFSYYYVNPNCHREGDGTACDYPPGFWRLSNGDYIGVTGVDLAPPSQADLTDSNIGFPIEISVGQFVGGLSQTTRSKIHIDARLILRPHYDVLANSSHTVTSSTTLGNLNSPFVPVAPFQWVDQDVTLQVEVSCDSPIIGTPYVFTMPVLRTRKSLFEQLSPFLTPIAIIGRPPGNQSWSSLTATSGGGATFALYKGRSTNFTTEESYGFGPFDQMEPTETIFRSTTRGIHQTDSFRDTLTIGTHNPYPPGEGDAMICLVRPTYEVYTAARDMDFNYLRPADSGMPLRLMPFPMRELLNPQPGTPLSWLTASENAAFRALNPLLGNPHAVLSEPRYYRVLDLPLYTGTFVNGSTGTMHVTRTDVDTIMRNSTTYSDVTSYTIPVGGILQALGSPLPISDLDLYYRYAETHTASTEYRTMKTLEHSSGDLVDFEIADSNPAGFIYVQVYYDTYFRTFAFRDAGTPQRTTLARAILGQYKLADQLELLSWKAFRYDDANDSKTKSLGEKATDNTSEFLVIGSLRKFGIEKGLVEFTPVDKSKPKYRVFVFPGTGNVMLANLIPGDYQFTVNKKVYLLKLNQEGEVTFK